MNNDFEEAALMYCPFCNYKGDNEVCLPTLRSTLYQGAGTRAGFTIYCQNCGATCGDCSTSDDAREAWNTRQLDNDGLAKDNRALLDQLKKQQADIDNEELPDENQVVGFTENEVGGLFADIDELRRDAAEFSVERKVILEQLTTAKERISLLREELAIVKQDAAEELQQANERIEKMEDALKRIIAIHKGEETTAYDNYNSKDI